MPGLNDIIGSLEGGSFDTLVIESNVTPPITLSLKPPSGESGPPPLLGLIKPRFTLQGAAGSLPFAPAGDPSQNVGWLPLGGAVLALVLVGFVIGRLVE